MLTVQEKPRPPWSPTQESRFRQTSGPRAAATRTPQLFLWGLLFVLTLSAILYMVLSANWPKFSRAEVFFAECAREMLRYSNLVTPLYHGKPFFDKPILTYWLIMAAFKLLGVSHVIARVPSMLAALAAIAGTAVGTALIANGAAGLLAAMAVASSFMFLSFAALCMSDMLLVCLDTLSLSLLYAGSLSVRRRTLFWWLAALSMGLAFLTKGPVGLALPAASFLIYMAVTRQLGLIRLKHVLLGAATAAVVASPWFLAAYQVNGMGAINYFFVHENLQRFAGSTYDTHRPFWFIVASLFTGFAPWSIFLPLALWKSIGKWRNGLTSAESRQELYLWLWVAVITLFFSASRGKIDYYVLPAYPAAAALTGMYLARSLHSNGRPLVSAGWGLALGFVVAGLVSAWFLPLMLPEAATSQWLLVPGSLCIAGLLMALSTWRRRYFQVYSLAFAGICLATIGFGLQILPAISDLQPILSYCAIVRENPKETRVALYKTLDNWVDEVTFQTGREPQVLNQVDELAACLRASEHYLIIVPEDKFQELPPDALATLRILESRPFIAHSLNPGFAIKRRGRLFDDVRLLLISNQAAQPEAESKPAR